MPFSLSSYLLGVGTVVGALALGVGSGVLVTKTAVQETAAAGPTGAERVARAEPMPVAAPQLAGAKENPAPPVEPAPAVRPDPVPSAQTETPKADIRSEAGAKQPEPPKQGGPENQTEQREAAQKKAAERRVERQKNYPERKARSLTAIRTKQRPLEWQDQPEPPEFAFGREEPRWDRFRMLGPPPFDRSEDRDD